MVFIITLWLNQKSPTFKIQALSKLDSVIRFDSQSKFFFNQNWFSGRLSDTQHYINYNENSNNCSSNKKVFVTVVSSDGTIITMSGLGPPGVWAAQKRLESWARAARERTSSASSGQSHNSTDSFGDDKSHGSLNVSVHREKFLYFCYSTIIYYSNLDIATSYISFVSRLIFFMYVICHFLQVIQFQVFGQSG